MKRWLRRPPKVASPTEAFAACGRQANFAEPDIDWLYQVRRVEFDGNTSITWVNGKRAD